MPVKIIGDLSKNDVRISNTFMERSNGLIILRGAGNVVVIDTEKTSNAVSLQIAGGSRFEMHKNSQVLSLTLFLVHGSEAIIGENTYANGRLNLQSHEKTRISIGKDCLIGGGSQCMTSDMHSIIDVELNERINPPGDVIVEDHVWIGFDVALFKSTRIGTGSIVGGRSTVSGEFRANSLILGYPARVVRRGVKWRGALIPMPKKAKEPAEPLA